MLDESGITDDGMSASHGTNGSETTLARHVATGARHAIDDAAKALRVELRQLRAGDVAGGVALVEAMLAVIESESE